MTVTALTAVTFAGALNTPGRIVTAHNKQEKTMLSRARIRRDQWKLATAVLVVLTMLFTFAPAVHAQAVAVAEVSGHVTDPSGQAIVGATVRMTETDRNQVRTTTSDATGRYVLSNLPVGAYRLEVTSPGFKGYIQNGITLQVA